MHGPNVGMDQIASAAGVAVGTLYRHFPTKSDLVAAVIGAFVSEVADRAEAAVSRVEQGSPAFSEFAGLLGEIVQAAASNHAVKAAAVALNADVDDSGDAPRTCRGRATHFRCSSRVRRPTTPFGMTSLSVISTCW